MISIKKNVKLIRSKKPLILWNTLFVYHQQKLITLVIIAELNKKNHSIYFDFYT